MEESGLMGGGQGDGPADSHPTSGLSLFKGKCHERNFFFKVLQIKLLLFVYALMVFNSL
jgi:hypothetical protein